jgi:DNA-directed RNA polymerase subunit RPC12/RpoP
MAIVSCTACQKKLKVADASVGKKVKCACGHVFVAELKAEASDKIIVNCTECGTKLKVAPASLGTKMKCPKCSTAFMAGEAKPTAVSPIQVEDDLLSYGDIEVKSEPAKKLKKGKSAPIMYEDADDELKAQASQKRPVPRTGQPVKYPSRRLANAFVFLMLFVFLGLFAGVYLYIDEPNLLDPESVTAPTNRKLLESCGWPVRTPVGRGP